MGHEVETIDRRRPGRQGFPKWKDRLGRLKRFAVGRAEALGGEERWRHRHASLLDFRDRYVNLSPVITSACQLREYFSSALFEAVIVGSDQVWRPRYSPSLADFYLGFLDGIPGEPRRISFAASFGVDHWEYTRVETAQCRSLLQKFDAVSVRERSGQDLCRQHFGIEVECVVDPTLLLEVGSYPGGGQRMVAREHSRIVLAYLLDPTREKQQVAERAACDVGGELYSLLPRLTRLDALFSWRREEFAFPRVEDWIGAFRDADFVVTDSFHGCVFAILFNKPFAVLANPERGLARFSTLLEMFQLQDRYVRRWDDYDWEVLRRPIHWSSVSLILEKSRRTAKEFLRTALR